MGSYLKRLQDAFLIGTHNICLSLFYLFIYLLLFFLFGCVCVCVGVWVCVCVGGGGGGRGVVRGGGACVNMIGSFYL